ncbi:SWPV1-067 [Shearwaterpox virus]|uniref:SWPV1-067 n=1 Tax=Shearwaterpox virus TaxID=1974596 RepID=A0A1V0QGW3_CNPV|nr:SWPV1-067 [Shearwaterpox virus]
MSIILSTLVNDSDKELFKVLFTCSKEEALEIIYRCKPEDRLYIAIYIRRGDIVEELIKDKQLIIDSNHYLLYVFASSSTLYGIFNDEIDNNYEIKNKIIEYTEYVYESSLHSSVSIVILRELLRGNLKLEEDDFIQLEEEIKKEELHIAEILLESNIAVVNEEDSNGHTPLYFATKNGHLDMVRLLLWYGADPNTEYVLNNSIMSGKICLVKTIMRYIDIKSIDTSETMCLAAETNIEVVSYLIDKGFNVNTKDSYGDSPLHYVTRNICSYDNLYVAKLLIKSGANVNARNRVRCTPLHNVVSCCNKSFNLYYEMIKYLIDNGANLEARDITGQTPLYFSFHKPEMVKILLDLGADTCNLDNEGLTPLQRMIQSNISRVVPLYSIYYMVTKIILISTNRRKITVGLIRNMKTIIDNAELTAIRELCERELERIRT